MVAQTLKRRQRDCELSYAANKALSLGAQGGGPPTKMRRDIAETEQSRIQIAADTLWKEVWYQTTLVGEFGPLREVPSPP